MDALPAGGTLATSTGIHHDSGKLSSAHALLERELQLYQ